MGGTASLNGRVISLPIFSDGGVTFSGLENVGSSAVIPAFDLPVRTVPPLYNILLDNLSNLCDDRFCYLASRAAAYPIRI